MYVFFIVSHHWWLLALGEKRILKCHAWVLSGRPRSNLWNPHHSGSPWSSLVSVLVDVPLLFSFWSNIVSWGKSAQSKPFIAKYQGNVTFAMPLNDNEAYGVFTASLVLCVVARNFRHPSYLGYSPGLCAQEITYPGRWLKQNSKQVWKTYDLSATYLVLLNWEDPETPQSHNRPSADP